MASYYVRILVSIDQLGNTILDGDPDETISSRVGRNAIAGKKWALIAEKVINALFWFQPNHCRAHIEVRFYGTPAGLCQTVAPALESTASEKARPQADT